MEMSQNHNQCNHKSQSPVNVNNTISQRQLRFRHQAQKNAGERQKVCFGSINSFEPITVKQSQIKTTRHSTDDRSEKAAVLLTRLGTPCVTIALIISADKLSGP